MNLKTGVTRKQSTSNFSKIEDFLPLDTFMHVCLSGGRKCSFWENLVYCFLVTPLLRFAFLPYYQWIRPFHIFDVDLQIKNYFHPKLCSQDITLLKLQQFGWPRYVKKKSEKIIFSHFHPKLNPWEFSRKTELRQFSALIQS